MDSNRKCIIDNWSLEQAGFVLDNTNDINSVTDNEFETILGGLSNFINALLLYEDSSYLQNGFESEWTRFKWFKKNTNAYIDPLDSSITEIDWKSELSYSDEGVSNYLITANVFEADLFISPERSIKIINSSGLNVKSNFISTLQRVDDKVSKIKDGLFYDNIKIGIENNFKLPSLTQYVLAQATSLDDLFTVIMQLKSDGKIARVKEKINELTHSTKSAIKLQNEIDNIIDGAFGIKSKSSKPFSLKISILFLSISKSFNLNFFNRKEHLVFLKNIAALRSENFKLQDDLKRIFNRVIR